MGIMAIKKYSILPRYLEMKPHLQMQFSVISRTRFLKKFRVPQLHNITLDRSNKLVNNIVFQVITLFTSDSEMSRRNFC